MTQEEMTYNTKSALASALKIRLKTTPLGKISIRELSEDCDINRQTFYYHFKDIYDLLNWTFIEDINNKIFNSQTNLSWQDALRYIFDYLQENNTVALNAYKSIGHDRFQKHLFNNFSDIMNKALCDACRDINIDDETISFFSFYCMTALLGLIETKMNGYLTYSPEEIISHTENILSAQIEGAKKIYGEKTPNIS